MDNIIIDDMTISDLDSISNVLEKDFDDFWSYNLLKEELTNRSSKVIIAKLNDEIIGFASISVVLDTAHITNIVIKKAFRGKGFSTILLKKLINIAKINNCKCINLEVNSNNIVAINLYKKFEFKQVGLRKKYYNNGDALLFSIKL